MTVIWRALCCSIVLVAGTVSTQAFDLGIDLPDIDLPDIDLPEIPVPGGDVELPGVGEVHIPGPEDIGLPPAPDPNVILQDPTVVIPDPQEVIDCIGNPGQCVENLPNIAVYQAVWPIVAQYKASLVSQADGRWKPIPQGLIGLLQPYFGIDLSAVAYAEEINTVHGAAITFSNRIFFPRAIDLSNRDDLWWLLHELTHSLQYASMGGEDNFLGGYVISAAQEIVQNGSINIHDEIALEQMANEFADRLIDYVFGSAQNPTANSDGPPTPASNNIGNNAAPVGTLLVVTNYCREAIDVAVAYQTWDGRWVGQGFYTFGTGESDSLISDTGGDIRLLSPAVYYHAHSQNMSWPQVTSMQINGQTVGMAPGYLTPRGDGSADLAITCN